MTNETPSAEQIGRLGLVYLRSLDSGAHGSVHACYDPVREQDLAVKLMHETDPESIEQLKSEFRIRADLLHPNLLQLYELREDRGTPCLLMELVRGARRFDGWVTACEPDATEWATNLHGLASALHTLHSAGLVHRDVKPANVLVSEDGTLKLVDFGLALSSRRTIGVEPDLVGTPAFLAPEVQWGAPHTPSSDVYALALTVTESLTGERARLKPPNPPVGHPLASWLQSAMSSDPEARPTLSRLVPLLESMSHSPWPPLIAPRTKTFVGRTNELDRLTTFLAEEGPRTLQVVGDSGVGKSTLIESALRGLDGPLVLRGRCHPREFIAFQVWDRVVHTLALHGVPPGIASARPSLARLFPALARFAAGVPKAVEPDRAFLQDAIEGFCSWVEAWGLERGVVIWLDDLQWASADSLELLTTLIRRTTSNVAVVSTCRANIPSVSDHVLELGPLDREACEALLSSLGQGQVTQEIMDRVSRLPMLAELVGHQEEVGFDTLVDCRLTGLDAGARDLLTLVSLCPQPLEWGVLREADGVPVLDRVVQLEQVGLVRRFNHAVFPDHDRIRASVQTRLAPSQRVQLHNRLAEAHRRRTPDAWSSLAYHLEHAERGLEAAEAWWKAADRASGELAFATANGFLKQTQRLNPNVLEDARFHADQARNSSLLGRQRESGDAWNLAAERADGNEALRLRGEAARHWIRGGDYERGYDALRSSIGTLGVRLPTGPNETLFWSIALRLWLFLLPPKRRQDAPDDSDELLLELLWVGCSSLSHINHALADVFLLRHLRLAEQVGTPSMLVKSLTFEAVAEATLGGSYLLRRSDAMFERARVLLGTHPSPYDEAWVEISWAARRSFDSDWQSCIEASERANTLLEGMGPGVAWEQSVSDIYRAIARSMAGDLDALQEDVDHSVARASIRQDAVALNGLTSGHPRIRALVTGESAPPNVLVIARGHRWPENDFTSPDYYDLVADVEAHLYMDRGEQALAALDAAWPGLNKAAFLRLRFVGLDLHALRARAGLCSGRHDVARQELKVLERSQERLAPAFTALIRAGLEPSAEAYDSAARSFAEVGMHAHAEACRLHSGIRTGDSQRSTWLGSVQEPAALVRVLTGISPSNPGRLSSP